MEILAYGNSGRAQKIYEASDATEQLTDFFNTILCPLLTSVQFEFPNATVTKVSSSKFPYYFKGEELIVSGQLITNETVTVLIHAISRLGDVTYSVNVTLQTELGAEEELTCFEEKLNAYLHIRQLLEMIKSQKYIDLESTFKQDITDYAIQQHFVTELTSIIVHPIKPDADQSCGCQTSCSCSQSPGECISTDDDDDDDDVKINPSDQYKTDKTEYDRIYLPFAPGPVGQPGPTGVVGAGGVLPTYIYSILQKTHIITRLATTIPPTTTTPTSTPKAVAGME